MLGYIFRRMLFAIPIVFGVMLLTFVLFFVVQSPSAMAKRVLGTKATPQAVENWLHNRGYDKPLLINTRAGEPFYDSLFLNQVKRFAVLDLGRSDVTGRPLGEVLAAGALPSLMVTVPAFLVGFGMALGISLYLVYVRHSGVDLLAAVTCVGLMSLPSMVYIIFGQYVVAQVLSYFPAFGFNFEGFTTARFLVLPVALMVVSGLGAEVRLYRALFLEEMGQDYIRTARAKGASTSAVLLGHVLKNGLINLITVVVASLPFLIMGSLMIENFFGIPGLGNVLFDALHAPDFAVVQGFVFLGSILYLAGLILTDICYAWVDPRIRFR